MYTSLEELLPTIFMHLAEHSEFPKFDSGQCFSYSKHGRSYKIVQQFKTYKDARKLAKTVPGVWENANSSIKKIDQQFQVEILVPEDENIPYRSGVPYTEGEDVFIITCYLLLQHVEYIARSTLRNMSAIESRLTKFGLYNRRLSRCSDEDQSDDPILYFFHEVDLDDYNCKADELGLLYKVRPDLYPILDQQEHVLRSSDKALLIRILGKLRYAQPSEALQMLYDISIKWGVTRESLCYGFQLRNFQKLFRSIRDMRPESLVWEKLFELFRPLQQRIINREVCAIVRNAVDILTSKRRTFEYQGMSKFDLADNIECLYCGYGMKGDGIYPLVEFLRDNMTALYERVRDGDEFSAVLGDAMITSEINKGQNYPTIGYAFESWRSVSDALDKFTRWGCSIATYSESAARNIESTISYKGKII